MDNTSMPDSYKPGDDSRIRYKEAGIKTKPIFDKQKTDSGTFFIASAYLSYDRY